MVKMVLDFNVKNFCQNLRATKPPYKCPVDGCGKVYKSFSGIQFHLYNFDHENPETPSHQGKPSSKKSKKKAKWHHRQMRRSPTPPEFFRPPVARENLSYAEAQRLVEVDLDGQTHRIDIHSPLEIISQDEIDNQDNTEKEEKAEKSPLKMSKGVVKGADTPKGRKDKDASKETKNNNNNHAAANAVKLPEAQVRELDDYVKPSQVAPRPSSYYRYIEKSVDELDEEVEYDMDEEDHSWLELLNDKRKAEGLVTITQEEFETLMDRFEKEAAFQSQSSGKDQNPSIDEDAVCSICYDGECQNSNVILFCDMCNLAVHQECYGVPYIPEGQWLCRRCLQSPSRAVDCCLCPNKGGAFKQTDDNRWAHVVCALWIPEVGFANTVFLEPIDSIDQIPPARKKLSCYICKQRNSGACIQCHKTNCYTAFHVTCAQQAGLFMKIEAVKEVGPNGVVNGVRKTAFCDVHTPANQESMPMMADEDRTVSDKKAKEKSRVKMRKARKILAEKRNAVPVVSIPMIPQHKLYKIASLLSIPKKEAFLKRLLSYWTLKRQSRFGVPLLRRLQTNHMSRNKEHTKNDKQSSALREQLKYWQRLRQDLEKARLLVELIRKREKMKREEIKLHQEVTELTLQPFVKLQREVLQKLQEIDIGGIFASPVSLQEVPDYLEYITTPMDFSTMKKRVESHHYRSMDDFERDFELIYSNCITYNAKDTVFYKAALKLRDSGGQVVREARRTVEKVGYDMETGLHMAEVPRCQERATVNLDTYDSFMKDVKEGLPLEEQLRILLDKMDQANTMLKGNKRSKFAKRIKREIFRVRRKLALQKGNDGTDMEETNSMDAASSEAPSTSSSRQVSPVRSLASPAHPRRHSMGERQPTRGRGRGRGKARGPGRPRSLSTRSEPDHSHDGGRSGQSDKHRCVDISKLGPSHLSCESKGATTTTPTTSPTGVNRRTAVLFSKKSRATGNTAATTSTATTPTPSPRKGPGRPRKNPLPPPPPPEPASDRFEGPRSPRSPRSTHSPLGRGPASPLSRKRSASTCLGEPSSRPSAPKRTMSLNESMPSLEEEANIPQRDSFKVYRLKNHIRSSSESESTSELNSGDESSCVSESGSSSNGSRSDDNCEESDTLMEEVAMDSDSDDTNASASASNASSPHRAARQRRSSSCDSDNVIDLEPLDLVWAKCRGYPWYPALIINPKMPKTGYFHNGVPIPVPPDEVLALQNKNEEPSYLVLFFDTKRTWQWLPRNKLEPLGHNSDLDKQKLMEQKKPNVRKAVQKAYEKAVVHRCSVSGQPNPLSGDSSSED